MLKYEVFGGISFLADAALMLPLAGLLFLWLVSSQWRLALSWGIALLSAGALVLVSKLIWATWHYTVPFVNFRMISGHTMLAAAVWPALLSTVGAALSPGHWRTGRLYGWVLCVIISAARLFHAHTVSEILAGLLVGGIVENVFATQALRYSPHMRARWFAIAILAVVAYMQYGVFAQDMRWINELAALIKGWYHGVH